MLERHLIPTIIFIIFLYLCKYFMDKLKEKHPELSYGELINYLYLNSTSTILFFSCIAINIGEGGFASFIAPEGQTEVIAVLRFCVHMVLSILSIGFGVWFLKQLRMTISILGSKSLNRQEKIWRAFLGFLGAGICLAVTLIFPILNLLMIANGVGQVPETMVLLYEAMPDFIVSAEDMQKWYIYYDVVDASHTATRIDGTKYIKYNIYAEIDYAMIISSVMVICHYSTQFGHNILSMTDIKDVYNMGGDINSSVNYNASQTKKKARQDFPDVVRKLLLRIGYKGRLLKDTIDIAERKIDSVTTLEDQMTLSVKLSELYIKLKKLDDRKGSMAKADYDSSVDKVLEETRDFFGGKLSRAEGLGMPLKKPKKSSSWTFKKICIKCKKEKNIYGPTSNICSSCSPVKCDHCGRNVPSKIHKVKNKYLCGTCNRVHNPPAYLHCRSCTFHKPFYTIQEDGRCIECFTNNYPFTTKCSLCTKDFQTRDRDLETCTSCIYTSILCKKCLLVFDGLREESELCSTCVPICKGCGDVEACKNSSYTFCKVCWTLVKSKKCIQCTTKSTNLNEDGLCKGCDKFTTDEIRDLIARCACGNAAVQDGKCGPCIEEKQFIR